MARLTKFGYRLFIESFRWLPTDPPCPWCVQEWRPGRALRAVMQSRENC